MESPYILRYGYNTIAWATIYRQMNPFMTSLDQIVHPSNEYHHNLRMHMPVFSQPVLANVMQLIHKESKTVKKNHHKKQKLVECSTCCQHMLEEIIQQDTLDPHWRRDAALMLRVIIVELNEPLNTQDKLVHETICKTFIEPYENIADMLYAQITENKANNSLPSF